MPPKEKLVAVGRICVLKLARALGLFALARKATANRLRILCYHGISLKDEHLFRAGLFMTAATFDRRMRHLADKGYPVLGLEEALTDLKGNRLPKCATVITIDDGWFGTYSVMGPVLKRFGFPATLYVSTYYMEKGTQVFNVALRYIFWATDLPSIDLSRISPDVPGTFVLADKERRAEAERLILGIAERASGAVARQVLLRQICETLAVDWHTLETNRMLAFMAPGEARELAESGIDIQLHTHRHRFPSASEELTSEIQENRKSLAEVTTRTLSHLCYPSGEYSPAAFPRLSQLGIDSATTTRRGMNTRDTPLLELRRLLDSDATPDIVFEAEMSGFLELCRRALKRSA